MLFNLYNEKVERKGKVVLNYIFLGAVALIVIIYFVVTMLRLRKAVTNLTQEQFIEGYRKAQLIDVREAKDYDAGHILGARNIPYSQFRQRFKEIRSDKPVYLYDQNGGKSARSALFLKKKTINNCFTCKAVFVNGQVK